MPGLLTAMATPSEMPLSEFSQVSSWLWSQVGLFLKFLIGQPILLLAMSLFFIGVIVAFLFRVYSNL